MRYDDAMRASDGVELALTRYEVSSPRAILCGLHGVGEHARRYEAVADAWNGNGVSLRMLDYRGHGRSPGKRGDAPYARTMQDVLEIISLSAQDGPPVFLMGHSFGGGLALHMLITQPLPIAAGIVTSPWLRLKRPLGGATVAMLNILGKAIPSLTIGNGLDATGLCCDRAKYEAYASDPLVHDRISLNMALGARRAGIHSIAHADEIGAPLLLMHGGADPVCDVEGSREFARKAGELITYAEYPGMLHELHNEEVWRQVFRRQLEFVESVLKRSR